MESLLNKHYNSLYTLYYLDEKHIVCRCKCSKETIVHIDNLINGTIISCGCIVNTPINITGKYFGEWLVDKYEGNRQWRVVCSCGTVDIKDGGKLRNGYTKSCKKCTRLIDLKGKTFGELEVLEYVGSRKWRCKCSCKKEIQVVGADLRSGHTTSCGHATTGFKDITGQRFGLLKAIRYVGNQNWECECQCEDKIKVIVDGRRLRGGMTKSCGCISRTLAKNSMISKYGEDCSLKIYNPRENWQIEALKSKDNLEFIINSFNVKPTTEELSNKLGINASNTLRYIHKYNLEDKVVIGVNGSKYEKEIIEYIKSLVHDIDIVARDRSILNGKELDILVPSKKLAIEFNGDYWHSDCCVEKTFHQYKTLECAKQGIRLLHIFEYEWKNERKKEIIKNIIKHALNINDSCTKVIYGRAVKIVELDSNSVKNFVNSNHLQGHINSAINLVALFENKIVAVMSFSKPRFNNNYDYEITRLCFDKNVIPYGITEKFYKYFLKKYKPMSVITYVDIAKFSGNIYSKLGFKTNNKFILEPNYVWVNHTGEVLTRYQTQKHKLIESGLGKLGDTEDEIMRNIGYLKIYDSGNLKLEWLK